jgi:hypothetical protein
MPWSLQDFDSSPVPSSFQHAPFAFRFWRGMSCDSPSAFWRRAVACGSWRAAAIEVNLRPHQTGTHMPKPWDTRSWSRTATLAYHQPNLAPEHPNFGMNHFLLSEHSYDIITMAIPRVSSRIWKPHGLSASTVGHFLHRIFLESPIFLAMAKRTLKPPLGMTSTIHFWWWGWFMMVHWALHHDDAGADA